MQAELGRLEKAKQAACTVVPVALEMKWVHLEKIVSYMCYVCGLVGRSIDGNMQNYLTLIIDIIIIIIIIIIFIIIIIYICIIIIIIITIIIIIVFIIIITIYSIFFSIIIIIKVYPSLL